MDAIRTSYDHIQLLLRSYAELNEEKLDDYGHYLGDLQTRSRRRPRQQGKKQPQSHSQTHTETQAQAQNPFSAGRSFARATDEAGKEDLLAILASLVGDDHALTDEDRRLLRLFRDGHDSDAEEEHFQEDMERRVLVFASLLGRVSADGHARMELLRERMQHLKNRERELVFRSVEDFKKRVGLQRVQNRVAELESLLAKHRATVAEKKYTLDIKRAETSITAEDLRRRYEAETEEQVRALLSQLEKKKKEIEDLHRKHRGILDETERILQEMSVVLFELDKEEKALEKQTQRAHASKLDAEHGEKSEEGAADDLSNIFRVFPFISESFELTDEMIDRAKGVVQQTRAKSEATKKARGEAEEERDRKRVALQSVVKGEESRALDRLKKMVFGLEEKMSSDEKRTHLLESLLVHLKREKEREALPRGTINSRITSVANGANRANANRSQQRQRSPSTAATQLIDSVNYSQQVAATISPIVDDEAQQERERDTDVDGEGSVDRGSRDLNEDKQGSGNDSSDNEFDYDEDDDGSGADNDESVGDDVSARKNGSNEDQQETSNMNKPKKNKKKSRQTVLRALEKSAKDGSGNSQSKERGRNANELSSSKAVELTPYHQLMKQFFESSLSELQAFEQWDEVLHQQRVIAPHQLQKMSKAIEVFQAPSSATQLRHVNAIIPPKRTMSSRIERSLPTSTEPGNRAPAAAVFGKGNGSLPPSLANNGNTAGLASSSVEESSVNANKSLDPFAALSEQAKALVVPGQEEPVEPVFLENYGYTIAAEQLSAIKSLLGSWAGGEADDTSLRSEEEELKTVEKTRTEINQLLELLKANYRDRQQVQNVAVEVEREHLENVRALDRLKAELLHEVEGLQWSPLLQPGQYQIDIDSCKMRIADLKKQVKMKERRLESRRMKNVQLVQMLTDKRIYPTDLSTSKFW